MNRRIVFLCPFFKGKFVPYFQLFLNSCRDNPKFDWMLFTDNEDVYDYPSNVHKIKMTFDEVKNLFQSKFNFPICLDKPYKLCDYKPSYGYVFSDYIKEYDFWGHNDCDVIYGNLDYFITDEMLDSYDKLFIMGHFTLYRNTMELSSLFMKDIHGRSLYREIFTSKQNMNFDEDWKGRLNINDIFREYGYRVYENKDNRSMIADIYDKSSCFRVNYWDRGKQTDILENKKNAIFVHHNGKLLRFEKIGRKLNVTEYMYIHLIHRKMHYDNSVLNFKSYMIIPDTFIPVPENMSIEIFDSLQKKQIIRSRINYLKLRWKNFKTKINKKFSIEK